jgi:pimeloyl-ACP methyl ester carboxylesterase
MTESSITRRGMIGGFVAGPGIVVAAASKDVIGAALAQSTSRTFVLVHGAFGGGWAWRRVSDLLQKKGHRVFSPTLTGLGERSHLLSKDINLDTHITDIVNVIKWEDLENICLVAHSYGGWPASGAIEQVGSRVSSIVWVDAFKPEDGQKAADLTSFRQALLDSAEKGELSFPRPKAGPTLVNEKDRVWVESKLTPQPIGTYVQPIKLSGARDRVAKKTYVRLPRFANPAFDKALAECKADKSWNTFENNTSGHAVMADAPEWLADILLQAS